MTSFRQQTAFQECIMIDEAILSLSFSSILVGEKLGQKCKTKLKIYAFDHRKMTTKNCVGYQWQTI